MFTYYANVPHLMNELTNTLQREFNWWSQLMCHLNIVHMEHVGICALWWTIREMSSGNLYATNSSKFKEHLQNKNNNRCQSWVQLPQVNEAMEFLQVENWSQLLHLWQQGFHFLWMTTCLNSCHISSSPSSLEPISQWSIKSISSTQEPLSFSCR